MKPISPAILENYRKTVAFCESIKDASFEEYVYLLSDIEFAIETIEWKLGSHPLMESFWKFYIKFLKDKCRRMDLLNVYSRYCRLFIADTEMRAEYLVEIRELDESLIDATKWWIDYIGIENHFGSPEVASHLFNIQKARKSKFSNIGFPKIFESLSSIFQVLNQSLSTNYLIQKLSLAKIDKIPRTSFSNVRIEYVKGFSFKVLPIQSYPSS